MVRGRDGGRRVELPNGLTWPAIAETLAAKREGRARIMATGMKRTMERRKSLKGLEYASLPISVGEVGFSVSRSDGC